MAMLVPSGHFIILIYLLYYPTGTYPISYPVGWPG